MEKRVYIRISKSGKIEASRTLKEEPIRGTNRRFEPTVFLALDLTIPDEAFKPPTITASISVPIEKIGTAIHVVDPMKVI
jgi:hypothetical protein